MFKHAYQNSSGAAVSYPGNFNKITAGAQDSTRLISVGTSSELSDGSDIEAAVTFRGFTRRDTPFAAALPFSCLTQVPIHPSSEELK